MSTDADVYTDISSFAGSEKLIAFIGAAGYNPTLNCFAWRDATGWYNLGTVNRAFKDSYFGYSGGYKALVVGAVAGSNDTVCIGYNPSANPNGGFSGNGSEVYFRNGVEFGTPNSADTSFYRQLICLKDGFVGIGTSSPAKKLHVSGPSGDAVMYVQGGGTASAGAYVSSDVSNVARWSFGRENIATGDFLISYNETVRLRVLVSSGTIVPGADNLAALGTSSNRFSVVFSATGSINTSDERDKEDIGSIPDAWLDAWGAVEWRRFKFKDRSRWHIGLIAQRVHSVFADRGIDAFEIGLCCFDEWEDEFVPIFEQQAKTRTEERVRLMDTGIIDRDDNPVFAEKLVAEEVNFVEEVDTGKRELVRAAGDRWGLRYDECFAMEAAWQRREIARQDARIAALEAAK